MVRVMEQRGLTTAADMDRMTPQERADAVEASICHPWQSEVRRGIRPRRVAARWRRERGDGASLLRRPQVSRRGTSRTTCRGATRPRSSCPRSICGGGSGLYPSVSSVRRPTSTSSKPLWPGTGAVIRWNEVYMAWIGCDGSTRGARQDASTVRTTPTGHRPEDVLASLATEGEPVALGRRPLGVALEADVLGAAHVQTEVKQAVPEDQDPRVAKERD
jgi:hypothetical protein